MDFAASWLPVCAPAGPVVTIRASPSRNGFAAKIHFSFDRLNEFFVNRITSLYVPVATNVPVVEPAGIEIDAGTLTPGEAVWLELSVTVVADAAAALSVTVQLTCSPGSI